MLYYLIILHRHTKVSNPQACRSATFAILEFESWKVAVWDIWGFHSTETISKLGGGSLKLKKRCLRMTAPSSSTGRVGAAGWSAGWSVFSGSLGAGRTCRLERSGPGGPSWWAVPKGPLSSECRFSPHPHCHKTAGTFWRLTSLTLLLKSIWRVVE